MHRIQKILALVLVCWSLGAAAQEHTWETSWTNNGYTFWGWVTTYRSSGFMMETLHIYRAQDYDGNFYDVDADMIWTQSNSGSYFGSSSNYPDQWWYSMGFDLQTGWQFAWSEEFFDDICPYFLVCLLGEATLAYWLEDNSADTYTDLP